MDILTQQRLAHWAQLPQQELTRELAIPATGLTAGQVHKSRQEYGSNAAFDSSTNPYGISLKRALFNPFSLILLVLGVVSLVLDLVHPAGASHNISSTFIIFGMLLVSTILRLTQEIKAQRVARELLDTDSPTVRVYRDGTWTNIAPEDLVVGDQITLTAGDAVPADLRLVTAQHFFVSQAALTGESGLTEKTAEALPALPAKISAYANIAFRGSAVLGGNATGMVVAVGANTLYGALPPNSSNHRDLFVHSAKSIAAVLLQFMACLIPLVFIASGLTKGSWLEAFLFALAVAVGLTPELLPMVITACLARGGFRMSKKQTVVKNINAMQGLGSMDVLCVDKTGTLTQDQLVLEYFTDVLGNESSRVLDLAYLNSHFQAGGVNPIDSAVLRCRTMPGKESYFQELPERYRVLDAYPFDYEEKLSRLLLFGDKGRLEIIKGAVAAVVARCSSIDYQGEILPIGDDRTPSVGAIVDEMTEEGMKVIAIAYKEANDQTLAKDSEDYVLAGYLAFFDAPKKSAAAALESLQDLHVQVRVLSGDNAATTLSVCRRLNLPTDAVVTGAELAAATENDLPVLIERTRIFAELTPQQKKEVVHRLQANGHVVGFLGDGLNDLPAELQADVCISVDTAVPAVQESCDVLLLKKDLMVLKDGILEGRRAFLNMAKYTKITASSNLGNIISVAAASVLLPFFPMSSLQILLLNLLYDTLCLILPWDKVDREQLCAPIRWSGASLRRFMVRFGPISSIFDLLTFAFLFFVLGPLVCGAGFSHLDAAQQTHFIQLFQTGWFLESMWTQVLILHLLRTSKIPFVESRPANSVIWVTLAGIVSFTLLTWTPFAGLFGLTALPASYYAFLLAAVLLYLCTVTLAKQYYCQRFHELI